MAEVKCIDCLAAGIKTARPIDPDSGPRTPRCATHKRAKKKSAKANAHDKMCQRVYNLPPGGYQAILDAQGGRCYICRRATGASKAMAVDHAHSCCPPGGSCGKCVRAICCSKCNHDLLGHVRDDPEVLRRAIEVITQWPAQKILKELRRPM